MSRTNPRELADHHANKGNDGNEFAQSSSVSLPDERVVFLSGEVAEHTITHVQAQLISLAGQSKRPITLIVSTYGGSIDEMFSLYDTMRMIDVTINTVGLGKIMSAGVLLLAAGQKGNRRIGKHARIMIHPISGGGVGNVFEIQNDMLEHVRLQNLMVDALIAETKITRKRLDEMMKAGHDFFITAEDAVKFGIVDALI